MHCSCNELYKVVTVGETGNYSVANVGDTNGDGYLDVIDAYLLHLFINGFTTVDVYAVGDYDLNGVAFEEADIKAIKHAIEIHWFSIVLVGVKRLAGLRPTIRYAKTRLCSASPRVVRVSSRNFSLQKNTRNNQKVIPCIWSE